MNGSGGLRIAIVGGDARQKEIAYHCLKAGVSVYVCGFDLLEMTEPGVEKVTIDEMIGKDVDAVVFPVSGVQDGGIVRTSFSREDLHVTHDQMNRLHADCCLFSGIETNWLRRCRQPKVYLMDEDDIAIYNSIPTAEGVLWLLLQHTDHTIHGSTVLVSGFGRTGISIARLLCALGANVLAASDHRAERARMVEMGIEPLPLAGVCAAISRCDSWINTIPSEGLFEKAVFQHCPRECLVVELASGPKAIREEDVRQWGIRCIDAPSLPGIIAPKTAGAILANAILERLLKEEGST